jgi:hypothetical protein
VETLDGNDWAALLANRSSHFVDVHSPVDVYPEALWSAAAAHFALFPFSITGGRYACGQELKKRGLVFLANRSLGQICHIVQLAISQKKLLGFKGSAIVPYNHSQSMVKDKCAQHSQPANAAGACESIVSSWDLVRVCLRELLESADQPIPLSNIKRTFRAKFQLELSETALGHSKLSALLQDSRLANICEVRLEGSGYVIAPCAALSLTKPSHQMPPGCWSSTDSPNLTPRQVYSLPHQPALCESVDTHKIGGSRSGAQGNSDGSTVSDVKDESEDSDEDYDAAVELFHHPSELHESIASVHCPWGPTPDGSFIYQDESQHESLSDHWPQLMQSVAKVAGEAPDLPALQLETGCATTPFNQFEING